MPSLFEDLWAAFYDDPQYEDMSENIGIAIENFYVNSGIISQLSIPDGTEVDLDTSAEMKIIPPGTGPKIWTTATIYHPGTETIRGFTKFRCIVYHTSGTFYEDWLVNGYWIPCEDFPGKIIEWPGTVEIAGYILLSSFSGAVKTVGPTGSGATYSGDRYRELYEAIGATVGGTKDWAGGYTITLPDKRGIFTKGAGTTTRPAGKSSRGDPYSATLGAYATDRLQGFKVGLYNLIAGATSGIPLAYAFGIGDGTPITDGINGNLRKGSTTEPQSIGMNYLIKY